MAPWIDNIATGVKSIVMCKSAEETMCSIELKLPLSLFATDDDVSALLEAIMDTLIDAGLEPSVGTARMGTALRVTVEIEGSEDWILANNPELAAAMAQAEAEIDAGVRGVPLDEAFAQLT